MRNRQNLLTTEIPAPYSGPLRVQCRGIEKCELSNSLELDTFVTKFESQSASQSPHIVLFFHLCQFLAFIVNIFKSIILFDTSFLAF